jgi:hypothetical protein
MEFKGRIGTTLEDSEHYWPEPVSPPEGAPNVLIWLIDDMGYGHGKTRRERTVPITYSIEETFDVGEDTGSPIIEDVYALPFRHEHLERLTVRIPKDQ